jgi:hypothetical protein
MRGWAASSLLAVPLAVCPLVAAAALHGIEGEGRNGRPNIGVHASRGLQEPDLRASEGGAAGGEGRGERGDPSLCHGAVSEVVALPAHGGGGVVSIRAGPSAGAGACHADAVAASCSHAIHSVGEELEGGGSPDREGALCAEEGDGATPVLRCRLLPPEAAERWALDRWALGCPVHRPRVKVVGGVGGGQDLARCLAPGGRDGLIESIDLLPERAAVGMVGFPPADKVGRLGREGKGAAVESEVEGVAALLSS